MLQRATMTRYMILLLIFLVHTVALASNTEVKHQFTVTHIMLEMLQNQEEEDISETFPQYDSNKTINPGGEKR